MEKLRIVVGGFIGLYPTGGVTWDYLQYPLGLSLLGHDVYYIEDTMQYPAYQSAGKSWDDPSDSITYLKETMEKFALGHRWAYRDVSTGSCFGLSREQVLEICRTADVFINVSASTFLRDEYLAIPNRILIDSDPMFTQIQDWDDNNEVHAFETISTHLKQYNYLFTFGENIHAENCRIPTYGLKWHVTRQPVCIPYWKVEDIRKFPPVFTSVMNWATRKKLVYKHETWGQKDVEFNKICAVPSVLDNITFQLIVADNSGEINHSKLRACKWNVLDPLKTITTIEDYQQFIANSTGEFSVAKETYVKSNSGWFSCRSACYLASGRPVVTQDTKWSDYIPSGEGLFAFTNAESAIAALEEITAAPERHSALARQIACEYFDSNMVLTTMLSRLN